MLAAQPIQLYSHANAGIRNSSATRLCWLASAVQLLEVTTLPLQLQGTGNVLNEIVRMID